MRKIRSIPVTYSFNIWSLQTSLLCFDYILKQLRKNFQSNKLCLQPNFCCLNLSKEVSIIRKETLHYFCMTCLGMSMTKPKTIRISKTVKLKLKCQLFEFNCQKVPTKLYPNDNFCLTFIIALWTKSWLDKILII